MLRTFQNSIFIHLQTIVNLNHKNITIETTNLMKLYYKCKKKTSFYFVMLTKLC